MSTELSTQPANGRMASESKPSFFPAAWRTSETILKFADAFVAAQCEMGSASKDKTNPHFKSKYADLSSVSDACRPALNAKGIGILQAPIPSEPTVLVLETTLLHKSGEWVSSQMTIPLGKVDPQGYGSALTYARRYSLASMTGVCPEDDDGQNATRQANNRRDEPRRERPTIPLATQDQLQEFDDLLAVVRIPDAILQAWLRKGNASNWEQMSAENMAKTLDFIRSKTPAQIAPEVTEPAPAPVSAPATPAQAAEAVIAAATAPATDVPTKASRQDDVAVAAPAEAPTPPADAFTAQSKFAPAIVALGAWKGVSISDTQAWLEAYAGQYGLVFGVRTPANVRKDAYAAFKAYLEEK